MATAGNNDGGSLPPDFFLTPHQQSLLFAALNANKQQSPATNGNNAQGTTSASNGVSLSPSSFKNSPMQTNGSSNGYQESPYLDNYDYDFGDSSFDFSLVGGDQAQMIGDVPSTDKSESPDADIHDKRSHPDDDDGESGNDSKRRESPEKIPKKPGRKPLTSEPTSKRKAQNRAAQRAFRERKEKHVKDLETKVEELEKASEAANHENSVLRSQVERITAELNQYKQRVSVAAQNKQSPREKSSHGTTGMPGVNDVNFQFEFPKFGSLPGPPMNKTQRSSSQPQSMQKAQGSSPNQNQTSESKSSPQQAAQFKEDLTRFSNVFTPSMASSATNGSRASLDSGNYSYGGGNTSSPSASSNSNVGPSSSCGTSPEPFTQSPMGFKPLEAMSTIGEEQTSSTNDQQQAFTQFANVDFGNSSLDFLSQQNGGQFDPQLFGGYREPQDNILSNPSFDEFFNDAFDNDFFTPYNAAPSPNLSKKNNLIEQIDAKQDAVEDDKAFKTTNCNEIWEKLQECPSAKNGDFDLDGLCSELTKKAKCSGYGPVLGEGDFNTILQKYMGKDASGDCVANALGVDLDKNAKPKTTAST